MTLASITKRGILRVAPSLPAERERVHKMDHNLRKAQRDLSEVTTTLAKLRREVADLQLRDLDPVERLRALLARVEHYQPVYGLPDLVAEPARPSTDRAERIASRLGALDGLRVLDIGSSLGYMDFYLADRGATTLGWEMNIRNVEVARAVAEITQIPAVFAARAATLETVDVVEAWKPDAILLLSVLHHFIYYQGLENAQAVVARLAASSPLLIAELARKDEDPGLNWSASQPEDPMDIFAGIEGGYTAEVLASYPTHLSTVARDLVAIVPNNRS
jgi:2-polyprenyl-3-methyl-5-hydroxy-6-metoxy-1,4-benzoquinol methylase